MFARPARAQRQQGARLPTLEPLEDRSLLSGLSLLSVLTSGAPPAPVRQLTAGAGALLGPAQVSVRAGEEVRPGTDVSVSVAARLTTPLAGATTGVGLGLGAAPPLGGVLPLATAPAGSAVGGAATGALSPAGDTSAPPGLWQEMANFAVVIPSERVARLVEPSNLAGFPAGGEVLPALRPGEARALPALGAGSAAPADGGEAGPERGVPVPGVGPEELPAPEVMTRATPVGGGARAELLGPVSDFFPLALTRLGSAARQALDSLADLEEPAGGWWVYAWALTLVAAATVSEAIHRRLRPAPEAGLPADGWGGPGLV